MSYQEIKRISQGRKLIMLLLVFCSIFLVFFKKVSRAQNTFEVSGAVSKTESNYTCGHQYVATYTFNNNIDNPVNKCEPVSVDITQSGLWAGRLVYTPPAPCGAACACGACGGCACGGAACGGGACGGGGACACACGGGGACACACGPPTDILSCSSQDDCLNKGNLYNLDSIGQGKGVSPTAVLATLTPVTSSSYLNCSGNQCSASNSGTFTFAEKVNTTIYYGQCVDTGVDIKMEGNVPESPSNQVSFNVVNRPPAVTLTTEKTEIAPEEEVNLTCKAVDPDCQNDPNRTDKISRVTWNCVNKQNQKTGCYFEKDGNWQEGALVENLDLTSKAANPYQSTVKFKAHNYNDYTIACEALDSDTNNPMNAMATAGVSVADQSADIKYCGIMNLTSSDENDARQRQVCVAESGDEASLKYGAYLNNINPESYSWTCDNPDTPNCSGPTVVEGSNGSKIACQCGVREGDPYQPTLEIKEAGVDTPISCNGTVTSEVTCTDKCSVGVRPWGSGDNPLPTISVPNNVDVEAVITKQCVKNDEIQDVAWTEENATLISEDPLKLKARFNIGNVLQSKIHAKIITSEYPPEYPLVCNPDATLNVKEKVQWRR